MTWFGWVLIAVWWLNPVAMAFVIGQERKPYTPSSLVMASLGSVVLTLLTLAIGTGSL